MSYINQYSSGGIFQLVAYGAQDAYLTNIPQINFFNAKYKKHSWFNVQPQNNHIVEQSIDSNTDDVVCSVSDIKIEMAEYCEDEHGNIVIHITI
jgi:hypothetical protein